MSVVHQVNNFFMWDEKESKIGEYIYVCVCVCVREFYTMPYGPWSHTLSVVTREVRTSEAIWIRQHLNLSRSLCNLHRCTVTTQMKMTKVWSSFRNVPLSTLPCRYIIYITLCIVIYYHYVHKSVNHLFISSNILQDCLIKNDRNWKSCQIGMHFFLHSCFLQHIRFIICELKKGLVLIRVVLQKFIYVYKRDPNN